MWKQLKADFREKVWDSEQALKLRQKFSELDTQTQSYILIGGFAGFVTILLLTFFLLWGKAISMKNQIAQFDEQIRLAQKTAVRIEELKSQEKSRSSDFLLRDFEVSGSADSFAERVGTKSLIAKSSVEVTPGKAGATMKLNKISLRQLTRALYLIEKSGSGASVEKLNVETKDDPEGYLWAELLLKKDAAKGGL